MAGSSLVKEPLILLLLFFWHDTSSLFRLCCAPMIHLLSLGPSVYAAQLLLQSSRGDEGACLRLHQSMFAGDADREDRIRILTSSCSPNSSSSVSSPSFASPRDRSVSLLAVRVSSALWSAAFAACCFVVWRRNFGSMSARGGGPTSANATPLDRFLGDRLTKEDVFTDYSETFSTTSAEEEERDGGGGGGGTAWRIKRRKRRRKTKDHSGAEEKERGEDTGSSSSLSSDVVSFRRKKRKEVRSET